MRRGPVGPCGLAAPATVDAGVSDEDAAEGARHRPSAGAAQGRGVRGRLVGGMEAFGGAPNGSGQVNGVYFGSGPVQGGCVGSEGSVHFPSGHAH